MADQYLDYLAGQQLALARQEDEIIALRAKLQAARETYEAFLESISPVIAVQREDHVRANASRITSTGEQERMDGCENEEEARERISDDRFNAGQRPELGAAMARRAESNQAGDHRTRQAVESSSVSEALAKSAIGAEPSYGEPVPKSAPREAQPAVEFVKDWTAVIENEPYDPGPMPGFLRKARA